MAHSSRSPSEKPPARTFNYVRPWVYPKQEAFLFTPARYSVVEASTKTGKTVGCIIWLFEQAIGAAEPGRNFWWVAPIYAQAKIAFRRLKQYLPPRDTRGGFWEPNESELTIMLANGSIIWFKGGDKPDSLYGEDVYAAVIDEATRVKEESFHAVRSTLSATRGQIRIIGNVKGRRNWAYQLARRAESGEQDMHYAKLTAYDAVDGGVLELAEVEDAKRVLPDSVFNELYLAIPSDDGGNPFGIKAIETCLADAVGDGTCSAAPAIVYGIDLAKSVDWTVVVGLDANGAVCRFERWQGPWDSTLTRIPTITGPTRAIVDATGAGDPIFAQLSKGRSSFEAFVFTSPSKQMLMEGLAVAIQQEEISFPDGILRSELDAFEYEYTRTGCRYSAPDGLHDDCVCALALAVHGYRQRKGLAIAPISLERPSHWKL